MFLGLKRKSTAKTLNWQLEWIGDSKKQKFSYNFDCITSPVVVYLLEYIYCIHDPKQF